MRGLRSARTDQPARYELGISVDGRPRPNIAISELALILCGHVLRLGVNETPNLIALDSLAGQIAKMLALIFETRFASIGNQLKHRIFR